MNIQEAHKRVEEILQTVNRVVVGQSQAVESLTAALLAGGHVLIEGVPGTAKTLLTKILAHITGVSFGRIQFTPDLMPSDITGVNIYNPASGSFAFQSGPVFTEILLADEINRAPAKTQAALLEAMEERAVTVDGTTHMLSPLFTVFATQNHVEFAGTYPLPEAQVDRFMLKVKIGYPDEEAEKHILDLCEDGFDLRQPALETLPRILTRETLTELRALCRSIHVEEEVRRYITRLVLHSRTLPSLILGASPRTSVQWLMIAKAKALVEGRDFVIPDDVKTTAYPVLRHRLMLRPEVEVEGMTPEDCIRRIVNEVPSPK